MVAKKLYICVTDSCNLSCKGCYKILFNIKPSFIDLNTVQSYIENFIVSNKDDTLECVFHGGEPFYLGGEDQLQKYINLIEACNNSRITWSATTNLIYNITSKHLELFNKFHNKFIKTSWDVDSYRFNNNEQLKLWENNVKLLIKEGFNIQPIITINNETIKHNPIEILSYFKNLDIHNLNFERITETGKAAKIKVKPTNREIDEWLYQAYISSLDLDIEVSLFNELKYAITDGFIGCRKRECMQNVRTINTDGSIGACPNCSDLYLIEKDGIYNKEIENELIQKEKTVPNQCKFCRFYKICNGDCCQLKFDETGCPGLIKIYEELLK